MKRSSRPSRKRRALTLVELVVATAVTALVLTSMCGIYFAVADQWQRQQGEGDALVAASSACSRLADYVSQSTGFVIVNRFHAGDTLIVNLPADRAHDGLYVPTWSEGKLQHRPGNWLVFYLSNSSGSYHQTGNILWAGTVNWDNYPWGTVPDQSWSLYYDEGAGRIAPLKSLRFDGTNYDSEHSRVRITATSSYRVGDTEQQLQITRDAHVRNAQ